MKCVTAEIAWHNREPVLSCDLHTDREHGITRLATAGADTHVIVSSRYCYQCLLAALLTGTLTQIWHLALTDQQDGGANKIVEAVCELSRHQKAVNVVRWSASGQYLASGDDEACIIIWKQKTEVDPPSLDQADEDQNKESWIVYKVKKV